MRNVSLELARFQKHCICALVRVQYPAISQEKRAVAEEWRRMRREHRGPTFEQMKRNLRYQLDLRAYGTAIGA